MSQANKLDVSHDQAIQNIKDDPFTGKDNFLNDYRHRIICQFLPTKGTKRLLDFGCGNGLFLRYLKTKHLSLLLKGYDPYIPPDSSIHSYSCLKDIPTSYFDLVTACDVIEHIEDDQSAITSICKVIKPQGTLVVTVPAFQYLYSAYDTAVGHYRRYDAQSLRDLLEQSGFTILKSTYFFASLVPVAIFRKYWLKLKRFCGSQSNKMRIPADQFGIFRAISQFDFRLMQITNFRCPLGFFLIVSARYDPKPE